MLVRNGIPRLALLALVLVICLPARHTLCQSPNMNPDDPLNMSASTPASSDKSDTEIRARKKKDSPAAGEDYSNPEADKASDDPKAGEMDKKPSDQEAKDKKRTDGDSGTREDTSKEDKDARAKEPKRRDRDVIRPFGYDFFDLSVEGFEPIPNMPAPSEYPLGPGDKIRVVLTSTVGQETDLTLLVDPSGCVRIPNVGFVTVSGLTITHAEAAISRAVRSRFPALNVQASVKAIRPIQVFVIGEVKKPGAYVLPGLSTLLNALYAAGGPNVTGSLRRMTVERNRKKIATIDLYELLLNGNRSRDITLQSGDSIFIPAIGPTVTVEGEVRRQAVFEMIGKTSVRKALQWAGGAKGTASLSSVRLERVVEGSRKYLVDLALGRPDSEDWDFTLQNGDRIILQQVLDDAINRVEILGEVRRPGLYEMSDGLTISKLVRKAEGFTDKEVYLDRVTILRIGPDGRESVLSADLGKAMAGDRDQDIILKPRDKVKIYSVEEAASLNRIVSIKGEVTKPGPYNRRDGMRVRDLIIAAGGVKPEAFKTIEIARIAPGSDVPSVINVNLDNVMKGLESDNIELQDSDQVSIRNLRSALPSAEVVTLAGEVKYPGPYALQFKGERLSSLIARAGGLTTEAFPDGAVFQRDNPVLMSEPQTQIAKEIQDSLKKLSEQLQDLEMAKYGVAKSKPATAAPTVPTGSAAAAAVGAAGLSNLAAELGKARGPLAEVAVDETRNVGKVALSTRIPIDLHKVIANPNSADDISLENGDTILIPKKPVVVSVVGAVTNPTSMLYKEGLRVDDYVRKAGGYARDADEKNTVVVRANGEVFRKREAGRLKLGDIVIVPNKALTAPRSRWDNFSDITRILSNLALTVAVTNNL